MGEQKFISDYCKWAKRNGYHCNERKSGEIFALAQKAIPSLHKSKSIELAIVETIKMIHSTDESRNSILFFF